ncbi:MAG TPA: GntR family transcriptional regulator [Spirillospora sp.]
MDLSDPRPLRDQVVAVIEERIRSGEYAVGSKIPTMPELARELDVGSRTVAEAVRILRERGILRGLGGRGTFVLAVPEEPENDGTPAQP